MDWLRQRLTLARSSEAATCMMLVSCDELEALLDIADVAQGQDVFCYWGGCGDCSVCRFNAALSRLELG